MADRRFRLLVNVNHSFPLHTGGSEKVVKQITESMMNDYGFDCYVLTRYLRQGVTEHNKVKLELVESSPAKYIQQIERINPDHILTYSDCFCHWPIMVAKAESIKAKQSVALVGMNYMNGNEDTRNAFVKKNKRFAVITHSDNYDDYQFCANNDIKVNVIHNAIDFNEIKDRGFSFREKYGIKTDKMILCVSNFFPGKGQEHLHYILNCLSKKRKDFTAIFISTTVTFNVANALMARFSKLLKKNALYQNNMFVDIPRNDVIQAFQEADVFAFPSQQEVAPLVMLESMASKTPWVSLNVGNAPTLSGGIVVKGDRKLRGQFQYTEKMYNEFANSLDKILSDKDYAESLGSEGHNRIVSEFNWDNIKTQYKDVFINNAS